MIVDCHGHYTTTPPPVEAYRNAQKEILKSNPDHIFEKGSINVSDDEIRDSIVNNQLKIQQERGTDVTIFSPRASWMGHHVGNAGTSQAWTEQQNDLIRRVCDLFPKNFVFALAFAGCFAVGLGSIFSTFFCAFVFKPMHRESTAMRKRALIISQ